MNKLFGIILLLGCSSAPIGVNLVDGEDPLSINRSHRSQGTNLTTLKLVQIIYRHGDRNPVQMYPTDPYTNLSYWPGGLGELTKKGKRQQYELGKYIRSRYDGFLSKKYDSREVTVLSSKYNRTVQSAQANLAGMYGIEEAKAFISNFDINVIPKATDRIIRVSENCPKYPQLYFDFHLKSDVMMKFNEDNKDVFSIINQNTKLNITYLDRDLSYFIDTLLIEKSRNLTLPDWAESLLKTGRLQDIFNYRYRALSYTPEMKRLRSGPMLKTLLENMETTAKNEGNINYLQKSFIYSAHETTVADVLLSLGIFDDIEPKYAAVVLVELHNVPDQASSDSFHVKVFYQNDSTREPYNLIIPNCDPPCTVKQLEKLVNPMIPRDWKQECDLNTLKSSASIHNSILLGFLTTLLIRRM